MPSFPPVGAVNKVFYLALAGTILGVLTDLAGKPRLARALVLLQPVVAALYIGEVRLKDGPLEVVIAAACGLVAIVLLSRDMDGAPAETAGGRAMLLAIACLGFAPIALLGASSSSFQLSLIFAFATFASLVWNIFNSGFSFGTTSFLGGVGGMISVVYAVTLITRKTDLLALAVLGLIFFVPLLSTHVLSALKVQSKAVRLAGLALLCLIPAASAAAVAILSYGSSFPI